MALRREMPAFLARTIGENTPLNAQLLGTALACALILANMSKGTADLFTFMALLTACATLWLYLAAALGYLKQRPGGLGSRRGARRPRLHFVRLLRLGPRSQSVEPRAARLGRGGLRDHAFARRLHPAGGGARQPSLRDHRAAAVAAKLRKHTSLVPSGPGS